MTPAPFRWALRGSIAQVRHISPVPMGAATGDVARIYAALEREFGLLAPPVALHSPDPALLAASWLLLRETLLVSGSTTRAEREVVAAAVSLSNQCPYCVEVHGATLGGISGRGGRTDAGALAADRIDEVADPRRRKIARWARSQGLATASFDEAAVPELLGVFLTFHYINRMVHLYLGSSPLPPSLPASAAATAGTMLGKVLAPTALRTLTPGTDADLLPQAELPTDLEWAGARSDRGVAVAAATAAIEAAGRRVLGHASREAVLTSVRVHGGQPPALGLDWVAPALATVPVAERRAAELALLTALVPQRVDDQVIAAFRAERPADADLLAITSWASYAAARRAAAVAARSTGESSAAA